MSLLILLSRVAKGGRTGDGSGVLLPGSGVFVLGGTPLLIGETLLAKSVVLLLGSFLSALGATRLLASFGVETILLVRSGRPFGARSGRLLRITTLSAVGKICPLPNCERSIPAKSRIFLASCCVGERILSILGLEDDLFAKDERLPGTVLPEKDL